MAVPVRLHDYQKDIKSRLFEAWRVHRSVMMQMPTGTGKTHVLAAVVRDFITAGNGTVWIIAHRRELVAQAEETIARYGIDKTDGRVRVLAIQWLSRHWDDEISRPSLVVIDEAHHARAKTYRVLWDRCPGAKFLGLTATPCRMSRDGFTDLFDTLITSWGIAGFIGKGFLSSFDYISIRQDSSEQLLIDSLEKRGADGDYQIKEMNDVLNRRPSIERLYASIRKFAANKKGIVYAISIGHARAIAEYYGMQGMNAVAIDSKTPMAVRKRLVEAFKAGEIQVLVNVDVFSEGFDCPDVEFVQMARPTLSLSKYLQQAGRGLRKSEGKSACILIDNVGLYRVFGLPTVSWDWESMFRGYETGRGYRAGRIQGEARSVASSSEITVRDSDMEVVVSHDNLLSALSEQKISQPQPMHASVKTELKAWQDVGTGLWGLRRGRRHITGAQYITVFDIRNDMAAVRFADNSCGLIDDSGGTIWKRRHCKAMKFGRNHFLTVTSSTGHASYLDLHSLRTYDCKPEIKRFGDIELLKSGNVYYSRTRVVYTNNSNMTADCIFNCKSYIVIFDYHAHAPFFGEATDMRDSTSGYVCILRDDYDSFYHIYKRLADRSLIVYDGDKRFYHVAEGCGKRYIGSRSTDSDASDVENEIDLLDRDASRQYLVSQAEAERKRQLMLDDFRNAMPFKAGRKWGLKKGDRITIPPIYRNVMPPVGKYCAVEKNYSQWGVFAVDGTVLVEPLYPNVEIGEHGVVTVTKVTGNKEYMKLP